MFDILLSSKLSCLEKKICGRELVSAKNKIKRNPVEKFTVLERVSCETKNNKLNKIKMTLFF